MSENWDIDIMIDSTGYQSKKQQEKTIQVYFVLYTRPASPSGIYGNLLLPLTVYAVNGNGEKENTISRYSH